MGCRRGRLTSSRTARTVDRPLGEPHSRQRFAPHRWTARGRPRQATPDLQGGRRSLPGDRPQVAGPAGSGGLFPQAPAGNVVRVAPRAASRPGGVRVRSLRTQQRTDSQCQFYWYFVFLVFRASCSLMPGSAFPRLSVGGVVLCHCVSFRPLGRLVIDFDGEFDPGSGRTLAACLTHASRTERPLRGYSSGERVSNTWATCPQLWDNSGKPGLILDIHGLPHGGWWKVFRLGMGPRPISLLVG